MEARVAARARAGLTNREIASALGIAVKTVERHLARAYRKLGVRSRAELRDDATPAATTKGESR